jgi:hypothetical protein
LEERGFEREMSFEEMGLENRLVDSENQEGLNGIVGDEVSLPTSPTGMTI